MALSKEKEAILMAMEKGISENSNYISLIDATRIFIFSRNPDANSNHQFVYDYVDLDDFIEAMNKGASKDALVDLCYASKHQEVYDIDEMDEDKYLELFMANVAKSYDFVSHSDEELLAFMKGAACHLMRYRLNNQSGEDLPDNDVVEKVKRVVRNMDVITSQDELARIIGHHFNQYIMHEESMTFDEGEKFVNEFKRLYEHYISLFGEDSNTHSWGCIVK